MNTSQKGRGGARPGAGRKPVFKVTSSKIISPESLDKMIHLFPGVDLSKFSGGARMTITLTNDTYRKNPRVR